MDFFLYTCAALLAGVMVYFCVKLLNAYMRFLNNGFSGEDYSDDFKEFLKNIQK